MEKISLYERLEVSKDASTAEIRSAYLQKARELHPDKNDKNQKQQNSEFVLMKEAYDVLSNSEKRFIYDSSFVGDHKNDISMADIKDIYEKFMSFVFLASHLYKKRKAEEAAKAAEEVNNHESSSIATKPESISVSNSESSPPPFSLQYRVKVTIRELFYGGFKTISINTMKLDFQTNIETFIIPLDISKKRVEFPERGDEYILEEQPSSTACLESTKRGSVIFDIEVEEDPEIHLHPLFSCYDLMVEVNISLYDYMFGKSFSIYIFDEKVKVRYKGGSPKTIVLENRGLPCPDGKRGACFVCLDLQIPTNIFHFQSSQDPEVKMFKLLSKKYLSI